MTAKDCENDDAGSVRRQELGALDEIVGLHISQAHAAVYRHFMETFSDLGVTQKQVSCLWLVADNPQIAQTDIARILRMDRATTMAIINRLQDRSFIKREPSMADKRRQVLKLTPDGADMLARAKVAIREHEDWLKSRFTAREVRKLKELLLRIHE